MKLLAFLLLFIPGIVWASPWQGFSTLALSKESRWLATGGVEGEVILWEAVGGEVQQRWQLPRRLPVVALSVSKDGLVAALSLDGSSWVMTRGAPEPSAASATPSEGGPKELQRQQWLKASPLVVGVRLVSGPKLVTGSTDGQLELRSGDKPPLRWRAHAAAVTGLALSSDSLLLYSCSIDGTLALWDAETGKNLGRL